MKFTRRRNGTLMATCRATLIIGRGEIHFAIYKGGEPPRNRRAALRFAVEKIMEWGTMHIEDNIDEEEWAAAGAITDKLFPELREEET